MCRLLGHKDDLFSESATNCLTSVNCDGCIALNTNEKKKEVSFQICVVCGRVCSPRVWDAEDLIYLLFSNVSFCVCGRRKMAHLETSLYAINWKNYIVLQH